uniref:F-box domain-containing protein n=1 Tax=Kalanchoe fedtschenkoi TaxID=63787 RepID=A0A7N0UHB1_KALFE
MNEMSDDRSQSGDAFSRLPEELIHHILSFLTLKDAAALAAVSKQWRLRWRTCRNLDLDVDFIRRHRKAVYDRAAAVRYVDWVNRILQSHEGERIDSFRVRSWLSEHNGNQIDQWIQFAVTKKAARLELDPDPLPGRYNAGDGLGGYMVPDWFWSVEAPFLEHLTLRNVKLGSAGFGGFKHLTSLCLAGSAVSQAFVQDIMCNCSQLRLLDIKNCIKSSGLKIEIPHQHPLIHLNVLQWGDSFIQIDIEGAQNLESLKCVFGAIEVPMLRKIQKLKKLHFMSSRVMPALEYVIGELGQDAPHLEYFHLTMYGNWLIPTCESVKMTSLSRLRHMSLSATSSQHLTDFVIAVLRICPVLQTLDLSPGYGYNTSSDAIVRRTFKENFSHVTLETINIYGFQFSQTGVDSVVYLLEHSVNLKKIQIWQRDQRGNEDGKFYLSKFSNMRQPAPAIIEKWFHEHVTFKASLVVL